jgi:hypothetical protein
LKETDLVHQVPLTESYEELESVGHWNFPGRKGPDEFVSSVLVQTLEVPKSYLPKIRRRADSSFAPKVEERVTSEVSLHVQVALEKLPRLHGGPELKRCLDLVRQFAGVTEKESYSGNTEI